MWGFGMNSGWFWVYGLVSIGALVVVIIWSVRSLRHGDGPSPVDPQPTTPRPDAAQPGAPTAARRLLDDRLARGEITAEQYHAQLRSLGEEP